MADGSVLVVGGAGYIGAHMVRALLDARLPVVVLDNLSTGRREAVPRGVPFERADLRDRKKLDAAFARHRVDAVMHFAASSLVGESVRDPLKYYENNVSACVNLLKTMDARGVRRFVFSSTAAVYGEPASLPIREDSPTEPTNPYGQTKLAIERMLKDVDRASDLRFASLRYFNACGAHESGEIGEWHEPETHLIPNVLKAALDGTRLSVFGDDYDTPDGTCVRDYVHVQDLCEAHVLALRRLRKGAPSDVFNLGNGDGFSVMHVIRTAEKVTGRRIRVKVAPRRPGDPARLVASSEKARLSLGWKPSIGLERIVRSAWEWELRKKQRSPKKGPER